MIAAIDNGLHGGIVAIDEGMNVVFQSRTPTMAVGGKRIYDMAGMICVLEILKDIGVSSVILEEARPMRGKGDTPVTAFSVGYGFGIWTALLVAENLFYSVVPPRTWQAVCKGIPGVDTKERSIALCKLELPTLDLQPGRCTTDHDGLADAGCMCLYGLRTRRVSEQVQEFTKGIMR